MCKFGKFNNGSLGEYFEKGALLLFRRISDEKFNHW